MLAHAKNASAEYPNIIIRSPDTDVFAIALNASSSIHSHLYLETGTKDKRRIISVSKVRENLRDLWSAALIAHFRNARIARDWYGEPTRKRGSVRNLKPIRRKQI